MADTASAVNRKMLQLDSSYATVEMESLNQVTNVLNHTHTVDVNYTNMLDSTNISLDYSNSAISTLPPDYYYENYLGNTSYLEIALLKQPPHLVVIYSLAYGLVFITALLGNVLVLALVIREPSMRNVTNYFIVNLAAADCLVALIIVPMTFLNNIFSGRYSILSKK